MQRKKRKNEVFLGCRDLLAPWVLLALNCHRCDGNSQYLKC
jgi:hypothetical protein